MNTYLQNWPIFLTVLEAVLKKTECHSHITQSHTILFWQRVHFQRFLKGILKLMLFKIYIKIKQCPWKSFKEKTEQ